MEKFACLAPRWLSPFSNLARPPFTLDVSLKCTLHRRDISLVGAHNSRVAVLPSFRENRRWTSVNFPESHGSRKIGPEAPWTNFKGEARRGPLAWHTYTHARTRVALRKYRRLVQARLIVNRHVDTILAPNNSKIRVSKHFVSHRGNERREEDRR